MIHFSFFSGQGGFDIAAEAAGYENMLSCDISDFCNTILKYYWPNAYHHTDIHTINYETINTELSKRFGSGWRNRDIILTGGFPCQPYSQAGKRKGTEDNRHLWPQMLRTIREIQPTWVVGENVPGLINWDGGVVFDQVQTDLETEGYEVIPFVLPAAGVNAPHRRDRIWFVAYNHNARSDKRMRTDGNGAQENERRDGQPQFKHRTVSINGTTPNPSSDGHELREPGENRPAQGESIGEVQERERLRTDIGGTGEQGNATNGNSIGMEGHGSAGIGLTQLSLGQKILGCDGSGNYWTNWPTQSPICNGNDGIPSRLDSITFPKWRNESIKAGGNAIVPQVALQIFKAINEFMILTNE